MHLCGIHYAGLVSVNCTLNRLKWLVLALGLAAWTALAAVTPSGAEAENQMSPDLVGELVDDLPAGKEPLPEIFRKPPAVKPANQPAIMVAETSTPALPPKEEIEAPKEEIEAPKEDVKPAPNVMLKPGPGLLKVLEQKASDRDVMAVKVKKLENELVAAKTNAAESSSKLQDMMQQSGSAKLQDMERKAAAFDGMLDKINKRDLCIAELQKQVKESQDANQKLLEQIQQFNAQIVGFSNQIFKITEAENGLRSTVDQLLLGNFEYYEVQRDDTMESIAAQPMIYGDASKKLWLIQANRSRVKDVEKLEPGEVIVVPRFPANGRFVF